MRTFLFVLFLLTLSNIAIAVEKKPQGAIHRVEILRVIDGDTVVFKAKFLPDPLKKELALRIYGVDTPEKGRLAKCPEEAVRSQEAAEFTKKLVSASKRRYLVLYDWDKYGGRVLGDLLLNGRSLREQLIASGYAREYYGDAKQTWCPAT